MGESETFEGWTSWVEDAYLLCTPEDPECLKHHYITRTEKDEPQYTVEEEIAMMNEQIERSEGFDIDFSLFRCRLFNYHLVDPDDIDFVEEPETNGDLMKRLSKESLNVFNKEEGTEFEFVKVVKANFHYSAGFMFLITFQVLDPSDNQEKLFQARVRYSTRFPAEYVFCRPRPDPEVDSDDTSEEDVKGWVAWLEPAFLLWKPGGRGYERPSYMTRTENDEPKLTPKQELALITKEVNASDGFDIDFSSFRCVFNYHPAILHSDQFADDEFETTEDFLKMLAQEALDVYNGRHGTEYEFVKVVKANYHFACAIMFLITFQVKDPYDDKIKLFQTRVRQGKHITTNYVFCRPKPNQGVEYFGIKKVVKRGIEEVVKSDVPKDVKKQKLEDELLCATRC